MTTAVPDVRDRLGRPLRDLRISLTDRCNFRCTYCMPRALFPPGHSFLPPEALLTRQEIGRIARAVVALGVSKIRLTGGEPLLRPDLVDIVRDLAQLGLEDLALTTNGALLSRRAHSLRAAGLGRVTISLDALDAGVFRAVSDTDVPLARVLEGIEAAAQAGFSPIKINAVVRRGVNESEILPLARYARRAGLILRFIEYMDVGETNGWRPDDVVPAAEIRDRVAAEFPLEALPAARPGEVARRWRYRDGGGELGLVSSVSEPFCRSCNRARLTSDGRLFTCLFASSGHDLKGPLRRGASDEELVEVLCAIWRGRKDRYSEERALGAASHARAEMSYIGG